MSNRRNPISFYGWTVITLGLAFISIVVLCDYVGYLGSGNEYSKMGFVISAFITLMGILVGSLSYYREENDLYLSRMIQTKSWTIAIVIVSVLGYCLPEVIILPDMNDPTKFGKSEVRECLEWKVVDPGTIDPKYLVPKS